MTLISLTWVKKLLWRDQLQKANLIWWPFYKFKHQASQKACIEA